MNKSNSLLLAGAPNFRDLGELQTADGARIRRGRLYRSERFTALTADDLAVIRSLGLRTVCDLRSSAERELFPNRLPQDQNYVELHFNILTDVRAQTGSVFAPLRAEPNQVGARKMMLSLYRAMPSAFAPHLARLVSYLTDSGLPLVIHCTAGKDRTGFAVAVLLAALGVERAEIYADYLLTARFGNSEERISSITQLLAVQLGEPPSAPVVATVLGVDADYLDLAFAEIDRAHGSMAAYLRTACGIDDEVLTRMRASLLA